METITKREFLDYINRQPDDKEVNMHQCTSLAKCGCVMVQYCREILNLSDFFWCGFHGIYDNQDELFCLEGGLLSIIEFKKWNDIKTYADIRKALKTSL